MILAHTAASGHLAFWVVAPPLLVAARPLQLATRSRRLRRFGRSIEPVARHRHAIAIMTWLSVVVTLYGTHLTPLYEQALQRRWPHDLEHIAYLTASVAFWSAVLGHRRSNAGIRVALAAASTAPIAFLGMILTTSDRALYDTYLERLGSDAALADQRTGGAVMWLGSLAALLPLLLWLPWRWATNEQRRQETLEQLPPVAGPPPAQDPLPKQLA